MCREELGEARALCVDWVKKFAFVRGIGGGVTLLVRMRSGEGGSGEEADKSGVDVEERERGEAWMLLSCFWRRCSEMKAFQVLNAFPNVKSRQCFTAVCNLSSSLNLDIEG